MRHLMNVKLVAVLCLSLSVSSLVAELQKLKEFGYETHGDCTGPCEDADPFRFYECFHFNPPGNTDCSADSCLQDTLFYIECEDGAPGAEEEECKTTYDAMAVMGTQVEVDSFSGAPSLNCGAVNAPFALIPGQPQGDCVFVRLEGQHKGKCLIGFFGDCDGQFIKNWPSRLGRDICD